MSRRKVGRSPRERSAWCCPAVLDTVRERTRRIMGGAGSLPWRELKSIRLLPWYRTLSAGTQSPMRARCGQCFITETVRRSCAAAATKAGIPPDVAKSISWYGGGPARWINLQKAQAAKQDGLEAGQRVPEAEEPRRRPVNRRRLAELLAGRYAAPGGGEPRYPSNQ